MGGKYALIVVLLIQVTCAAFFVFGIVASVFSLPFGPLSWRAHELIEIGAAVGLLLGVGLGALTLRHSLRRTRKAEDALRAASGAFMDMLEDHFDQWGLTPAERDVALFSIKGMSTAEIARLRDVSEGTVKAQTAAIYRKAGVSGRPQLLGVFIDELIEIEADEAA